MGLVRSTAMGANTMCRVSALLSALFETVSGQVLMAATLAQGQFPCTSAGVHGILEVEWESSIQLGSTGQRASGTWGPILGLATQ